MPHLLRVQLRCEGRRAVKARVVRFVKKTRRSTVKPLVSDICYSCRRPVPPVTGGIVVRRGRERGCWLYVSEAQLLAAGWTRDDPPPYSTIWVAPDQPRLVVTLYRAK